VKDAAGKETTVSQSFSMDGTQPYFDFLQRFILMSDHVTIVSVQSSSLKPIASGSLNYVSCITLFIVLFLLDVELMSYEASFPMSLKFCLD
jgi:hypothetical protein